MARRNQSMADDVIDITSRLPWWAGVLLAAASYLFLHSVADKGLSPAPGGDVSQAMKSGLIYAFASFGQYILPFLFGLGALLSVLGAAKRKKLHADVRTGDRHMTDISWQEFELLIGEHFRRLGFTVHETPNGPDGGIDLILKKNHEKYLVQCKHYKAYKVGVKPVRELLGVMTSSGAAGGYVITSGQFTKDAVAFARDNHINLVDGNSLHQIFRETPKPSTQTSEAPSYSSPTDKHKDEICPKCGNPLMVRVARKGARAGQKFYGCSNYPSCRFSKTLG
jgi:restriction system protein